MDADQDALMDWMTENLFHFSVKTVNSNAAPGGVRLDVSQSLDLPYISARTLLSEGHVVGLDYLVNAGKDATRFKLVRLMLDEVKVDDKADKSVVIKPDEKQAIAMHYRQIGLQYAEKGLDSVSPRLRQMLIPHPDHGYVAITPLGSAGLCEQIDQAVKHRKENRKAELARKSKDAKVKSTIGADKVINQFSVGGSNPQNVGGRVRFMSHPLVFDRIPKQNIVVKKAFALFYKGFRPRLPRNMVKAYAQWLDESRMPGSVMTMKMSERELAILADMAGAIRNQAILARNRLNDHYDNLPDTKSSVFDELRIWTDMEVTNSDARSQVLLDILQNYRLGFDKNQNPVRIVISPDNERRIYVSMKRI